MLRRLSPLLIVGLFAAGCLSTNARQTAALSPFEPLPAEAGDGAAVVETTVLQQSGQVNLAAELHTRLEAAALRADRLEAELSALKLQAGGDVKGFEYHTAVPIGQVVLMVLMLYLSHRREMSRIKQNGRHA